MSTSKMPAAIRVAQDADGFWTCREAISGSPEYIRADIVEAMAAALEECQSALASLTTPEAIKATNVASAWASCVAAEAKARSALNSYREASNVEA